MQKIKKTGKKGEIRQQRGKLCENAVEKRGWCGKVENSEIFEKAVTTRRFQKKNQKERKIFIPKIFEKGRRQSGLAEKKEAKRNNLQRKRAILREKAACGKLSENRPKCGKPV